jgi:hypothetical protein
VWMSYRLRIIAEREAREKVSAPPQEVEKVG